MLQRSHPGRPGSSVAALAGLALLAACRGGAASGDPVRPDAAALALEGVTYEGDLLVMESFPVQLAGRVVVTNENDDEVTLTFPDACVVLLRAYRGAELVWDQAAHVGCAQAIQAHVLEPGASRSLRSPTASAYDVLREHLPAGDYRMAAALHPGGEEIELDLGHVSLDVPPRSDRR